MKLLRSLPDWVGAIAFAIAAVGPGVPAKAAHLDVSATLGLTATAGLDGATRRLIKSLPIEIRQQVVIALKQSLPLVDHSVNEYLDRVNSIIDTQLTHMTCIAGGAALTFGESLKKVLLGIKPTPIEDLDSDKTTLLNSFSPTDSPKQYMIKYADFIVGADLTKCAYGADPISQETIYEDVRGIRAKWRLWYRLAPLCDNAADCFQVLHDRTIANISSADLRDRAKVKASTLIKKVHRPPPLGWFGKYRPDAYEIELGKLYYIDDLLRIAKDHRDDMAAMYWHQSDDVYKNIVGYKNHTGSYETEYDETLGKRGGYTDWEKCLKKRCGRLANWIVEADEKAREAANLDVSYQHRYAERKGDLAKKLDMTYRIYDFAYKHDSRRPLGPSLGSITVSLPYPHSLPHRKLP